MTITKSQFKQLVESSISKSEICRKLGIHPNGQGMKRISDWSREFNIDISHYSQAEVVNKIHRKYEVIEKTCPVCRNIFTTKKGYSREKTVCSRKCSNTFFRSGENNPNYKEFGNYRNICFRYHKKECIICGESKIVSVHHYDENNKNNEPNNLIPLCPTHHQYVHSRYKHMVIDKIDNYRKNYRGVA